MLKILEELVLLARERKNNPTEGSYTNKLLEDKNLAKEKMSLMRKSFSLWIISLFICNIALSDVIVSIDDVLVGGYPSTERSEEHTSELQSHHDLVCRLLLEKKK